MDVLIVYEGSRGSTQRTAEALVQAVVLHGHLAQAAVLEDTTSQQVAAADALLAGCWSEADEPFGGEATAHLVAWIEALPALAGKPIGAFCAYSTLPHLFSDPAGHADETLHALATHLSGRGATVAAVHAFNRLGLDLEAAAFVEAVFAAAHT
jgi:menaquinone-dependent protoporphyrinogen IX oxidase